MKPSRNKPKEEKTQWEKRISVASLAVGLIVASLNASDLMFKIRQGNDDAHNLSVRQANKLALDSIKTVREDSLDRAAVAESSLVSRPSLRFEYLTIPYPIYDKMIRDSSPHSQDTMSVFFKDPIVQYPGTPRAGEGVGPWDSSVLCLWVQVQGRRRIENLRVYTRLASIKDSVRVHDSSNSNFFADHVTAAATSIQQFPLSLGSAEPGIGVLVPLSLVNGFDETSFALQSRLVGIPDSAIFIDKGEEIHTRIRGMHSTLILGNGVREKG